MSINVLNITASIFGDSGVSSQLNNYALEQLRTHFSDIKVIHRDVGENELPHFNAETMAAVSQNEAELADTLIAELQQADIVLLGVPMYNFGVPSQLKAWFDHVARAGTTFKYTESGPVGLLRDRKVIINASRGGIYAGQSSDTQTPYLKTFLAFLGLKDVEFNYAEGLNLQGDSREKSIEKAKLTLDRMMNTFVQHYAQANAEEAI